MFCSIKSAKDYRGNLNRAEQMRMVLACWKAGRRAFRKSIAIAGVWPVKLRVHADYSRLGSHVTFAPSKIHPSIHPRLLAIHKVVVALIAWIWCYPTLPFAQVADTYHEQNI
jgi:hypothetical protein